MMVLYRDVNAGVVQYKELSYQASMQQHQRRHEQVNGLSQGTYRAGYGALDTQDVEVGPVDRYSMLLMQVARPVSRVHSRSCVLLQPGNSRQTKSGEGGAGGKAAAR
jgi:hypothetical protein